ncbi:MAG TPA: iron-sulfur cluster assembly accessory protein [Candidatus Limnocylindrales bacterium]|nr:iron-sulfur cluster assembly accessory protein [Candidatus Limnocylindrales bacterium]
MSDFVTEPIVQLTPKAIDKVVAARAAEGHGPDYGLRLSVVKGGCSGYEYSIKFAAAPKEGDLTYTVGALAVFVDGDSAELLRGTVLDYTDGLHGAGLKFVNPNASHSCGCGASFAAAED